MIRKGSCVRTKVGDGKVLRVDSSTYTIPLYIIKLTKGKEAGEKVALIKSEIRKIKKSKSNKRRKK